MHSTTRIARLPALFAAVIILMLTTSLSAASIAATTGSGQLLVKGPGYVYAGAGSLVAETINAGGTAQFELQVRNTSNATADYRIKLETGGRPATVKLVTGTFPQTTLTPGPDGYLTKAIGPGKTLALALRVARPADPALATTWVNVSLFDADGNALGTVYTHTQLKAPIRGASNHEISIRQGGQLWAGNQPYPQLASSPALAYGSGTTFEIKLQNNGPVPSAIGLNVGGNVSCGSTSVRDGIKDVSLAVYTQSYVTPVLPVNGSHIVTLSYKRVDQSCAAEDHLWFLSFPAQHYTDPRLVFAYMPFSAG
jgi:hypothetical protein